jgi:glycosyltransferase involved in cell wall biosynthesis
VLTHGLWYGGAQVSIVEFLRQIKDVADVQIVACRGSNPEFIADIQALGLSIFKVPYKLVYNCPDMEVRTMTNLIRDTDVVWMTDIEYLAAPKIKRIRDVPILAHLHSYVLICPNWDLSYGLQRGCTERCSPWRIIRCKQISNGYLRDWNLGISRARIYQLLDFIKGPLDFARRPIRNSLTDSIDRFIAVSHYVKDIHVARMSDLRNRIDVVPNPIPSLTHGFVRRSLSIDYNVRKGIRLIYGGGDSVIKGPSILLRAFKEVVKRRPEARLVCARCKGTLVEKYVRQLNLKNVLLLDKLTRQKFCELVSESHALVVPSICPEAFPNVALEAQYLGVPVVASNIGGIPEIVKEEVTGILVKPFDHIELSRGLVRLIDSLETFDRLAIHNMTSEQFGDEIFVSKIMNVFESISR